MKYLRLFETESEYQTYMESGEMILPNVSYIREIKRCGFKPYVEPPKVTLNYDCTEDNLLAFCNGSKNIKALKIDGKNIEFPPIVTGTSTVEILADEVSYNAETELYEFPDNYSITSVPTSLVIKPKDSSIKVNDTNIGCVAFMSVDGMKMCQPLSPSDAESMIVIDEVNNQITFTDSFLQEMGNIISMGYGYGFGLCNIIDLDSYQFDIIDSIQIYEGTSGGVATPYYFETPGVHTVEMELLNGDFGQMHMFYNPLMEEYAQLTSVIFNKNITSISQYTFVNNSNLSEITCESEIAPAINYSFVEIRKFGTLHYPEGSDYSSWLEGEGSLSKYSWNKEQPILTTKYNITDTTSPTKICNNTSDFTDIIIDGTPMSQLENSYTFSTTGEHEVIYKLGGTSIGKRAFYGCSGLTAITIPDSVTSIGNTAFSGCSGLTAITIPDSVTDICDYAFSDCSKLTAITIPDSVTSIGNSAFYKCSGLTAITIPDGVTSIDNYAFNGCSGLTAITCNATIAPVIESYTFYGVKKFGTLHYPEGSDYSSWLRTDTYYLGYYSWNKEQPILTTKYNITDTTSPTKICKGTSDFTDIIIDGTPMSPLENSYTFSTTGEHEVIYKLDGTSIGYAAFENCSGLTAITLNNGVTSIDNSAFENCSGLTAISLGNGVTSIGAYAFQQCSGLKGELVIPDSVTSIGKRAFHGCSGLTAITLNNGVTSIGESVFCECSSLTSIIIPDSVTNIGWFAFGDCSGLTAITIPDSVTSIAGNAFYKCSGLTAITIPDSVTEIGSGAFNGCSGLTAISLGNGVTSIGESVFYDCSGLTAITIPDSVTSIGNTAFYGCSGLKGELVIPVSVTSIGNTAFSGCSGLTAISLGNGVTSIGNNAFQLCTGLTAITIPDSVTSISNGTFHSCTGLTAITIPDSVTSIGNSAFQQCSGLTAISLGNGVTYIGDRAFLDCSGLTAITCNAVIAPVIESYTFYGVKKFGTLHYPEGSDYSSWLRTDSYYLGYYGWNKEKPILTAKYNITDTTSPTKLCNNNSNFTDIIIDGTPMSPLEISYTFSTTGEHEVVYKLNDTSISSWAFSDCSKLTAITIPDSVTEIGSNAFKNCSGLTAITIPDSVTDIGDYAFYKCSKLTAITIPDSVTSIGNSAFHDCSGLTAITIPDSVTDIGDYAFSDCSKLTAITIPDSVTDIGDYAFSDCSGLTAITIPDSVTSIGDGAFYKCSGLTAITIPDSVTSIGNTAFYGCSKLTAITCNATIAPVIESSTFYGVKKFGTLHYPEGSDYSSWMNTDTYYLGYYNWTVEYI